MLRQSLACYFLHITLFKIPHAASMHVCIYMYLQECVDLATLLTVSPAQTYNFVRHKLMLLCADKVYVWINMCSKYNKGSMSPLLALEQLAASHPK